MKWYVFVGVCIAVLIAVGILAVDERDVEWELTADGSWQPLCGYCRSELPRLAVVCPDCNRSLDWVTHRMACDWCLDNKDVEHLRDRFHGLGVQEEPLPGALAAFPKAYFLAMDDGSCTYCGGNGAVIAEQPCPVCRGDKRCVACGGDRLVVIGDEGAYRRMRERKHLRDRAERRASVTDLPLHYSKLLDDDVKAVRGFAEAEELDNVRQLLERGHTKLEEAFRALRDETQRLKKEASPKGS